MSAAIAIPKEKGGWLTQSDRQVIKVAAYTLGGLLLAGSGYWAVHKYFTSKAKKRSQREAFKEGTMESFANRIIMAFENDGWWGTNMPALRTTLREIPSKEAFARVMVEYKKQTEGREFFADLKSELTGSELLEMMNIIAAKPQKTGTKKVFDWNTATAIARRIKAACDYAIMGMPATDKGALKTALEEIPSIYAFAMVKVMYKKLYGHEVEEDLNDELGPWDFSWKDIVYTKPKR